MRKILLTQGKFAVVDNENFELVSQYKWYLSHYGYAVTGTGVSSRKNPKKIYMHRLIFKVPKGKQADHINQDKLDNRKSNLRIANRSVNAHNSKIRSDNTSGYRGISWDANFRRWKAQLEVNGVKVLNKVFKNKIEAILAYSEARNKLGGDYHYCI